MSEKIKRLGKIAGSNYLYIIWFVMNFLVCWRLFGGGLKFFFTLLVAYAISIFVAVSPIGETLFRFIESARPVLTKQEREYLMPIFLDVYETIKAQNPNIGEINLYIQDVMTVNAFAIGKHTVAVTKGAIETFTPEELKGVLAHEFGHIVHGDTMALIINTVGNGIFSLVVFVLKIYLIIIDLITNAIEEAVIFTVIYKFFRLIFEMLIVMFLFMGQAVLSVNSRQNEFDADVFAYMSGYGAELVGALYLLQKMSLSEKMSIKKRLVATHPLFAWRINKIEELIDNANNQ